MKWCYYIQKRKPPSLTQKSLRSVLRSSATTFCSRESPLESSNIQPLLQAPLQAAAQNPHSRRLAVKPNTTPLCSPLVLLSIVTQLTTESVAAVVQRPGFSALKSESENVNFTLENASEAYGQFDALIFVKDIFLCENKCWSFRQNYYNTRSILYKHIR